jgi:hypothetical protein
VKQDRTVIIIGVAHCNDKSVAQADYVLNDVQMLADVLRQRYCVAPERLILLKDADRSRIEQSVKQHLEHILAQTHVVVIFEGQAYAEGSEYYLATHDINLKRTAETGLSLKWLVETLVNCPSRDKFLILDTFHVGTSERYEPQTSPASMLKSLAGSMKNLQAIAAREDNQLGQEWPEKSRGSFAWQVALGFKGAADKNLDLHLDAMELFTFLQESLSQLEFDKSRPQTPHLFP